MRQPLSRLQRMARHPSVWVPLAVLAAAGVLVLLLGPVAWWATPAKHLQGKDKADARNATRQTLLAAVGGVGLLTGAAFTARTFYLTRRAQFTDRYTKAIAQLASEKLTERLGGIYALEHLMAESERDHPTVVEVLAAFIREHTRDMPAEPADDKWATWARPAADVQAALTVLGRRPTRDEPLPVDLSNARLRRAGLRGMRLPGVILQNADLRGADLSHANLLGAELFRARLRHARLQAAILRHARLSETDLSLADLGKASLQGARFTGADLTDAFLNEAHLDHAIMHKTKLDGAVLVGARLVS
ncbi:pentapeptide repeat-containing protein [Actinoplanes sp. NEAU-A12]|uniref:Pentapeptide repeat-containing protein n=1 Tax=Actinoplanes sandaracinus TaxID=3045177 RepID=A0ABT6WYN9_9ACTN|nr:pentapeptide repeat-containing protein [Actinoplanes sandaracinus]MDI6104846.1 pentapeptide repeat-containing protein [Actinoplanes sandaracinus]